MPSGRQAVCLASTNQLLLAPDFKVNSPSLTECSRTWSRSAARDGGREGSVESDMSPTVPVLVASDDVFDLTQLRIFTEPQQGATYDDLLAVARRADQLGFGAFFRSDHYLAMG